MPTKIETAVQKATELLKKELERAEIQKTLDHIANRTDPDGNVTLMFDDKISIKVPASIISGQFVAQKTDKEAELDTLADGFK